MLSSLRTALFASPTVRVQRNVDRIWRTMKAIERDWWALLRDHPTKDIISLSPEVLRKTHSKKLSGSRANKLRPGNADGFVIDPFTRWGKSLICIRIPGQIFTTRRRIQAIAEHELVHAFQNLYKLLRGQRGGGKVVRELKKCVEWEPSAKFCPASAQKALAPFSRQELKAGKAYILTELQAHRLGVKRGVIHRSFDEDVIKLFRAFYQAIKTEERRRQGLPTRLNPDSIESLI